MPSRVVDLLVGGMLVFFTVALNGCGEEVVAAVQGHAGNEMCLRGCEQLEDGTEKQQMGSQGECPAFCKCVIEDEQCLKSGQTADYKKECVTSCQQQANIPDVIKFESFEKMLEQQAMSSIVGGYSVQEKPIGSLGLGGQTQMGLIGALAGLVLFTGTVLVKKVWNGRRAGSLLASEEEALAGGDPESNAEDEESCQE